MTSFLARTVQILGGGTLLAAIALAMAPGASATDQEDKYDACISKGGEVAVCCIGVGGDYIPHPNGVEVCLFDMVLSPDASGSTTTTKPGVPGPNRVPPASRQG